MVTFCQVQMRFVPQVIIYALIIDKEFLCGDINVDYMTIHILMLTYLKLLSMIQ